VTDDPARFEKVGGPFVGSLLKDVELVDIEC
jgi:hypothetical protein